MAHFLLLFITLFIFPFSTLSGNIGKITVGASINATEISKPWLSPSGDFAFGLRRLQHNNTLFVLSIWFAKIPDQTIVWFERSSYPVPRGSILQLDAVKGFVLRDPQGNLLYSTDGLANRVAYALMSDAGNLLLVSQTNSTSALWESFNDPSDTILPTQTIEINGSMLRSKKTQIDFSYGRFYAGMNTDGSFVLNTKSVPSNIDLNTKWAPSDIDFDDEYYNSNSDSGIRVMFDESPPSISVVRRNGGGPQIMLYSSLPSSEYYYRATLDFDGVFSLYHHPKKFNSSSQWVSAGILPDHNICLDIDGDKGSGACGYNSVCRLVKWRPVCHCPEGFSLVDPNNTYGDCKPDFTENLMGQSEQDEYELLEIADVDWPKNDYQHIQPCSEDDCRDSCRSDHFCGAAIFRSGSCWKKRMPLSNGKVDTSLGVVTFLKVRKNR